MNRFRWVIVALMTIITAINYLDRTSIAFAILPLESDFSMNNTDFGLIGSAFSMGYLLMSLAGGFLVDRYGSKKIWCGAALFWSFAIIACGFSQGFWSLLIFRLALGLGEGTHFPSLQRAIADWLPQKQRARALSFCILGVPIGPLIGAPLLTFIIAFFGWRAMFVTLGSFGLIWFFFWKKYFHDHPQASPYVSEAEWQEIQAPPQRPLSWTALFKSPSFLSHLFAYFSLGYSVTLATIWFPGYLQQTFSLSIKQMGTLLLAPWTTAVLLILFGGWASDWLWRKTGRLRVSRSYLLALGFLVIGLTSAFIPWVSALWLIIVLLSFLAGAIYFMNPPLFAFQADLMKSLAGRTQGLNIGIFSFSALISSTLIGWLSHTFGNFNAVFFLSAGIAFLTCLILLLFHHPDPKSSP